MPIQPIEPRRLYLQIADQIRALIASGEFPPGTRLPAERDLAGTQNNLGKRCTIICGTHMLDGQVSWTNRSEK
ncbi:MAG: FadR family transcriptional regulator [Verrucomicrobia bacterium]|nr:FadR family transcriptional regulator [Verrucomicrobiota bacterium]